MHGCGPFFRTTTPAAIGACSGDEAAAGGRVGGSSCPHAAAAPATATSNAIAVSAWLADVDISLGSGRTSELKSITPRARSE